MSAIDTAPLPALDATALGRHERDSPSADDQGPPRRSSERRSPVTRRRQRLLAFARRHRILSLLAVMGAVAMLAVSVSFGQKLATPGNETVGEKAVEWLRDNHLGGVVNIVENQWYTHDAPPVGGAPRPIDVPTTTSAPVPTAAAGPDHLAPPAPVVGPASPAVAGEGAWVPVGPSAAGIPGMYTTQVRPDAVHTSFLELAVWMDPKIVRFRLHPGVELPGGTWSTPPYVADPVRDQLMAAFNGGFRMQDAGGGFYADGKASPPLRDGDATFVIDTNGVADVVQWGRDRSLDANVVSARQNLALIVDGGRPVADLDENPGDKWGATVGNKVFVWRSGVGVTAAGALVYVGGPSLSAQSLAETLVRVGAVRAMELDINHDWVSFNTYQIANGQVSGTKALPEMVKPGDRYLSTDSRDFVSVAMRDASSLSTSVPPAAPRSATGPAPAQPSAPATPSGRPGHQATKGARSHA